MTDLDNRAIKFCKVHHFAYDTNLLCLSNFEGNLKVRLCGKRLYPTESVKYLGVKIVENLNWQCQVNDLSIKLNRANALLFKIRKYVSPKILR